MADTPESAKDAKGRLKEAAGSLTGDRDLQREGKADQAGEKVKSGIDKVANKAKDIVDR
jgi:uncharacterized protein YjbJ (UPF0337 family)